jgi:hypothetical protein
MHIMLKFSILAIVIILSGCVSMNPKQVAEPSEITLACAMKQLGAGFQEMAHAQGGLKTGLIASEASVTFNVTASAKDSSKLAIDLSFAPIKPYPKTGNLGGELADSSEGQRGNTITVKFVSLLSFAKDANAANIGKLINAINEGDIHVFRNDEDHMRVLLSTDDLEKKNVQLVPEDWPDPCTHSARASAK